MGHNRFGINTTSQSHRMGHECSRSFCYNRTVLRLCLYIADLWVRLLLVFADRLIAGSREKCVHL